jgi:hypothetical protein
MSHVNKLGSDLIGRFASCNNGSVSEFMDFNVRIIECNLFLEYQIDETAKYPIDSLRPHCQTPEKGLRNVK